MVNLPCVLTRPSGPWQVRPLSRSGSTSPAVPLPSQDFCRQACFAQTQVASTAFTLRSVQPGHPPHTPSPACGIQLLWQLLVGGKGEKKGWGFSAARATTVSPTARRPRLDPDSCRTGCPGQRRSIRDPHQTRSFQSEAPARSLRQGPRALDATEACPLLYRTRRLRYFLGQLLRHPVQMGLVLVGADEAAPRSEGCLGHSVAPARHGIEDDLFSRCELPYDQRHCVPGTGPCPSPSIKDAGISMMSVSTLGCAPFCRTPARLPGAVPFLVARPGRRRQWGTGWKVP